MPIDYKKLAEDNETHYKLYKKAAEINALREGDIDKAELLSGKQLAVRPSQIEMFEAREKQMPIIKAIEEAKPPSLQDIGNIIQQSVPHVVQQALPEPEGARALPERKQFEGNVDAGIDTSILSEYTSGVLKPYGLDRLYLPSELITKLHPDQLEDYRLRVSELSKAIGRQKGVAKRQDDMDKWDLLDEHNQVLRTYNKRIKSIIDNKKVLGFGVNKIQYGNYLIDKKKLGKGILSISYPNGKKVNGYPNMKISDSVKKVLQNNKINKNYDLSESEKEFIRNFIDKSEAQVSKSKKKAICNKSWDRMAVLLGEIKAGNKSPVVKNELADIAHYFYKKKELDKSQYSKIFDLMY